MPNPVTYMHTYDLLVNNLSVTLFLKRVTAHSGHWHDGPRDLGSIPS